MVVEFPKEGEQMVIVGRVVVEVVVVVVVVVVVIAVVVVVVVVVATFNDAVTARRVAVPWAEKEEALSGGHLRLSLPKRLEEPFPLAESMDLKLANEEEGK